MLTQKRLETICRYPVTQEEVIIKALYEKGVMKMEDLSGLTGLSNSTIGIVVKDSNYLRKNKNLVCLERKGMVPNCLENEPYNSNSMRGYIFSLIVKKFKQGIDLQYITYKSTLNEIIAFCNIKKIDVSVYATRGRNIFATYKKEVKRYLETARLI